MCTVTKVAEGFVLVTVTNDRIRLRVTSFVIVGLPLVDPGKGLGGPKKFGGGTAPSLISGSE